MTGKQAERLQKMGAKSHSEMLDEHVGKIGTPERKEYEYELNMEVISERIKELRRINKLSQEELGSRIGVKKAQISRIENDARDVRMSTIAKVFAALGVHATIHIESTIQT